MASCALALIALTQGRLGYRPEAAQEPRVRWGLRAIPLFLLFTRVRGETVWKSGRGSSGTLALSGRVGHQAGTHPRGGHHGNHGNRRGAQAHRGAARDLNARNLDRAALLYAEDCEYVNRAYGIELRGRDGQRANMQAFLGVGDAHAR